LLQVASLEEEPVSPTDTSEGLLNLLLLADSSLQDTSNDQLELADTTAKQELVDCDQSDNEQSEKGNEQSSNDPEQGGSGGNEYSSDCEGSHDQTASSTASATEAPKRPTAAGMLLTGWTTACKQPSLPMHIVGLYCSLYNHRCIKRAPCACKLRHCFPVMSCSPLFSGMRHDL